MRNFGVRVVLDEPAYTRTNLDLNAPEVSNKLPAYAEEKTIVARAIMNNVSGAPAPDGVAQTIVDAGFGPWKMRRTPQRLTQPGHPAQPWMARSFRQPFADLI